tara:strand:+ start:73 stop:636 length:564 start_codon:yes stop_codon:yes gene_type:complete
MIFPNIVGIAGYARTGKDTFGSILIKELKNAGLSAKKLSLAFELKSDLDSFLIQKFDISAFTEDPKEKNFIRPLLICYGTDLMRKKDPKYWIKKLQKTIDINNNHGIISVVPDIRFVNEADWLKDNGGILAHLKRDGIVPADKNEERNDSLLREASDFAIDWKSFTEQQDSEKENIVKNFINEVTKN